MSKKIIGMKVLTSRECIETERERLKSLKKTDKSWWSNKRQSDWARREFGDDLSGEINTDTLLETCQICGKEMPLDERFLCMEFSFCEEYDCKMNLCLKCLKFMTRRLAKVVKELE